MKTVNDLISFKSSQFSTIDKNATVIVAFEKMESANQDCIVVVENGKCVGMISEVDYMHKIILARKNPARIKVREVMTSCICAVDASDSIFKCLELMDTFKIKHLMVFNGLVFKGIVSLHDLMLAAFNDNSQTQFEIEYSGYDFGNYISTTSYIS